MLFQLGWAKAGIGNKSYCPVLKGGAMEATFIEGL